MAQAIVSPGQLGSRDDISSPFRPTRAYLHASKALLEEES